MVERVKFKSRDFFFKGVIERLKFFLRLYSKMVGRVEFEWVVGEVFV